MQYAAVPQMMTQTGAIVQQMPPQMAMQFIQQGNGQDMNGFPCMPGQDANQATASTPSIQAQMNMIKAEGDEQQPRQAEAGEQGKSQQDGAEAQKYDMDGIGSSDGSSQE